MISETDFSARVGFTRRLRLSQVCPFNMTSQLASGSLAACVCLRSPSGHWVPGDALAPALPAARISPISDAEAALDSVELLGTSDPAPPGQDWSDQYWMYVRFPCDSSGRRIRSACFKCGSGSTPNSSSHQTRDCKATDSVVQDWVRYMKPAQ